jgi:hypothetical protein
MNRVSSREGYLEVAEMFKKLGDHRDSKERLTLCLTKAEESRKEALYSRAIREKGKGNVTGYVGAISLFESISGYKDANEQCAECQKLLSEIRQQTMAEISVERHRELAAIQLKEAAERAAQQKREENERIVLQRRAWRNAGRCQHCGGELKGFFTKKCTNCGKPKDYDLKRGLIWNRSQTICRSMQTIRHRWEGLKKRWPINFIWKQSL